MIATKKLQYNTCSMNRQKNMSLNKILIVWIAVVMFFAGSGTTAFAQEIDLQSQSTVTAASSEASDTAATVEDKELVLEDGYYIGEDGQIYYDESKVAVEEQVIEDTADEDITEDTTEDTTEEISEEITEEDSEDKAETSKTDTKKNITKPELKTEKKPTYSEEDLRLLSCLIYAEAGNQSYKGMVAVANVVLNRADSNVFWHADTIKEVIYDHKWAVQFSVTIKSSKTGLSPLDKALKNYDTGKFSGANQEAQKTAMARAIKAAKAALEGTNNIGDYLCFTNKRAAGSIKKKYPDYKIIGDHIFYRTK